MLAEVKEGTVEEAGQVNSSREKTRSKLVRKLGQAGVAGVEGSTMELLHRRSQEQIWSAGSIDLLIESAPQVDPPLL